MANRHTTERSWAVALITLLALAWWIFGTAGTLRLGMVGVAIEDDRITKSPPNWPDFGSATRSWPSRAMRARSVRVER